jgi:hypothetical protein
MKVSSKRDIANRKKVKNLVQKEDGDLPLSIRELNELFLNLDPADLTIAQKEYLSKIGMPKEVIEGHDDTLATLCLVTNIDEWAPILFRFLGAQRKRRQRERERIIAFDTLSLVDNDSALKIENWAFISKRISRLIVSDSNGPMTKILRIVLENADVIPTQKEIAKKTKMSQGTVSKTIQKIKKYLS